MSVVSDGVQRTREAQGAWVVVRYAGCVHQEERACWPERD